MYNKEISEKIVSDCFDMLDNIRESWRVCREIMEKAKRESESINAKIYGNELCNLYELCWNIERIDNKIQKDVAEMVDINGEVKGYDTETYLRLINLYEGIVKSNKEVNTIRNKIREKYM